MCSIYGERRYAMRVWLDPERLAGYGLTPQDRKTPSAATTELPAGRIDRQEREFSVTSQTSPARTPEGVCRHCHPHREWLRVRLRDVARVEGAANERTHAP